MKFQFQYYTVLTYKNPLNNKVITKDKQIRELLHDVAYYSVYFCRHRLDRAAWLKLVDSGLVFPGTIY